jgi:hypothetical protein
VINESYGSWENLIASSYFILVTSDNESLNGATIQSMDILKRRFETKLFPLYKGTRLRRQITSGDVCFFYLAGRGNCKHCIVGHATVKEILFPDDQIEFDDILGSPVDRYLSLRDITTYPERVPIHDIKHNLSFIKNTARWGVHFQGGTVRLQTSDATLIMSKNEVS